MNPESASESVALLNAEQRARFLAHLIHNLTIVARDTYDDSGSVRNTDRLRALNEIQHRVSSCLLSLLNPPDESSIPDDLVVGMFYRERNDKGLTSLLIFAFDRAIASATRSE